MGRKRVHSTWPPPKNAKVLKLSTKKTMDHVPVVNPARPAASVKARRSLLRRTAVANNNSQPVCFFRDPANLNLQYNANNNIPYVTQSYDVITKIGQGCFGDVFYAYSNELQKDCAIKISNDMHAFADFAEVRRWEKVPQHENCVSFYKAWQESFHLFIHMELCMTSLDKVLIVHHFIREAQCWDILTDLCKGLKNLHDNKLVHMDIKPANIMLTRNGVCKIGDFGLLYDLSENEPGKERCRSGLSVSEGDGKYVAIEVLREGIYTTAADIFSLGLMMMEVASDVALPSSGPSWEGLRNGALPLCYLRRKISRNFRFLIKAMVQKDHTKRPTVDEILRNVTIQRVMREHEAGNRINYLRNWNRDEENYIIKRPISEELLPPNFAEDPSPLNHSHVRMSFLPAVETPRIPLSESAANDQAQNGDSPDEGRQDRLRRVSRRLFDP